ncbi:2Fe-2S iron-sulfur cluster binding domain-containing protein [Anaerolineae bacterium CFX9]|nr:2Fe-2S iron-sulfur cluster binding domain-containing protein [Anaerolineae bacterium CFX9]
MTGRQMHSLTVWTKGKRHTLRVEDGANLRQALLDHGISPYAPLTRRLNCGGRGLCATCGVHIDEGEPAPLHWHDMLAGRFGYPRLSCQITVRSDMIVRILDSKIVWGARDAARRFSPD